tara:strand:+ start:2392 stop:3576 length:1185 start_codon:yes stop_codon:yes gene_type:complete
MKLPIYLDYAATTPAHKEVVEKMQKYLTYETDFGNPSSNNHIYGMNSKDAVEEARRQVAKLINAKTQEIVFTSGATEANNLAIKGVMNFYKLRGNHIITAQTEHKAVLDTCKYLETQGCVVTYLTPGKNGLVNLENIKAAITDKTILISIMHVNNEIGVIQDIESIGKLARENNILFHTDAVQSAGKLELDVDKYNIDLLSLSGHKMYGPKGIGALYIRSKPKKIRLTPQMHGGSQEKGIRSGTLATHQIAGLGEACKLARKNLNINFQKIKKFKDKIWSELSKLDGVYLNGDIENRIYNNLNISFDFVEGEALIASLYDLALSSGSACNSSTQEASYVLKAIGVNSNLAQASIRISLGLYITEAEVDYAIKFIKTQVEKLREISPLTSSLAIS